MFEKQKVNKAEQIFRHTPVWRAMIRIGIPSIIVALMGGLYTFIDQLMQVNIIPHDGVHTNEAIFGNNYSTITDAIKNYNSLSTTTTDLSVYNVEDIVRMANALVSPLLLALIAITLLFGMGTAVHYGKAIGNQQNRYATKVWSTGLQTTLFFCFIATVVMMGVGPAIIRGQAQIGTIVDVDVPGITSQQLNNYYDTYLETAVKYADYIVYIVASGTMFMGFIQVGGNLINAEGHQLNVMVVTIIGNLVNVLLDYLMMEFAKQGVVGSSTATVISYIINGAGIFFIIAYLNYKNSTYISLKAMRQIKFNFLLVGAIILIGVPSFLRTFGASVNSTLQQSMLVDLTSKIFDGKIQANYYQTLNGAILPIYSLMFVTMIGILRGSRNIMAYNFGSKDYHRVKQAYWCTTLYTFVFGVFLFVLISFGIDDFLLGLFKIKSAEMDDAKLFLMLTAVQIPIYSLQFGAQIMFQSGGKVGSAVLTSGAQGIFIGIPMVYIINAAALANNDINIFLAANAINCSVTGILVFAYAMWYVKFRLGKDDQESKVMTWTRKVWGLSSSTNGKKYKTSWYE